jgi:hypothetical protein
MKKLHSFMYFFTMLIVLSGCSGINGLFNNPNDQTKQGANPDPKTLSSDKDITDFGFPDLPVTGEITGNSISVIVPDGTDITGLIASFETNGVRVLVADQVQESGKSINDFTYPCFYTVEAEDGTSKTYTVNVGIPASAQKDFTTFDFDIPGSETHLDESKVEVRVPYGTNVSNLVANFNTTGQEVHIGGVAQITGVTPNDFTDPVTYTITATDGTTKDYEVWVIQMPEGPKITRFWLSGERSAYTGNIDGRHITVEVQTNESLDRLKTYPTFSIPGSELRYEGKVLEFGDTLDYSEGGQFLLIGPDGSINEYTVSIVPVNRIIFCGNVRGVANYMDDSPYYEVGASVTLPKCTMTLPGWTFAGWATRGYAVGSKTRDSFEKVYDDEETIIIPEEYLVSLYALWEPNDVFKVGDRGPGGGWIFYDKGYDSNGWRYLEADWQDKFFDGIPFSAGKTKLGGDLHWQIGTGEANSHWLRAHEAHAHAANSCTDHYSYSMNKQINDWFLPSINELIHMYYALKTQGLGDLQDAVYWSSSLDHDGDKAYVCNLGMLDPRPMPKEFRYRVRPIRAFSSTDLWN